MSGEGLFEGAVPSEEEAGQPEVAGLLEAEADHLSAELRDALRGEPPQSVVEAVAANPPPLPPEFSEPSEPPSP